MTDLSSPDYHDSEAIAARAYEIWQRHGCPQGTAMQDWYQAETELRNERRARLEATRLFEPPAPVELAPAASVGPIGTPPQHATATDVPAKRQRRKSAAAATTDVGAAPTVPKAAPGTRVSRKRPARPDA
jgi:hypothetical protein